MLKSISDTISKAEALFQFTKLETSDLEVNEKSYKPRLQEALIQAIWNEKCSNKVFTQTNKQTVHILFQGQWNDEAGPDFLNAKVCFTNEDGSKTEKTGDVEIHTKPSDWFVHNHDKNPKYANVILHVVWEESLVYPEHLPTVCLKNQLDSGTIDQINSFDWKYYPDGLKFPPCPLAPYLVVKSNEELQNFFTAAGVIRFREKVTRIKKEIISHGKEQALYQSIADALGYKNNRQQFHLLCQTVKYKELKKTDSLQAQAMLLGAAGLLPDPTTSPVLPELEESLKELWNIWWSKRPDNLLEINWSRQGRPLNSPERRVVALAEILAKSPKAINKIIESINLELKPDILLKLWDQLLTIENERWENLVNFDKKLSKASTLVGKNRRNEIIGNILLPFATAINPEKSDQFTEMFINLPNLQHNHIIKQAVNHFLIPPARSKEIIKNNGVQQGMIKLINETTNINEITPQHPLIRLLMQK